MDKQQKRLKRRRLRKRRSKMMLAVAERSFSREQRLAEAKKLSQQITKNTVAAGITERELQSKVYKTFDEIHRTRRTDRN